MTNVFIKLNVYAIDDEECPMCGEKELTFITSCKACHCGECGTWVSLDGQILEGE